MAIINSDDNAFEFDVWDVFLDELDLWDGCKMDLCKIPDPHNREVPFLSHNQIKCYHMDTYDGWRHKGFHVMKGEHHVARRASDNSCLFNIGQVEFRGVQEDPEEPKNTKKLSEYAGKDIFTKFRLS